MTSKQHFSDFSTSVNLWVMSVPPSRHFFSPVIPLVAADPSPSSHWLAASSPPKLPIKGTAASRCSLTGHSWWFAVGFSPVLCPAASVGGEDDGRAAAAWHSHPTRGSCHRAGRRRRLIRLSAFLWPHSLTNPRESCAFAVIQLRSALHLLASAALL